MQIGVIGLGRMGAAMALRLVEKGHSVVGWDIDPAARARSGSITVAASPQAVADRSEFIISSLPDDGSVARLFCSSMGLLENDVSGRVFIEMSTLRPRTAVDLSQRLNAAGADFVDAPVLGSIPAARSGTLLALVGGAPAVVERAATVLKSVTTRIFHMGDSGSGYATKLAVNLGLAGYIQSLAETLALSSRYDLPLATVLEVLKSAPTANPWLSSKMNALTGGKSDLTLDLVTLRKDLMSAVSAGADRGVTMPQTAASLSVFSAAVAANWGAKDSVELVQFFAQHMLQDRSSTSTSPAA